MLWDLVGDIRMLAAFPAALVLQVAHPAVGAGVEDFSVYRTDPWGRGERSLRSLQTWVYGGERAAAEGRRLRALHRTIRGTDAHGRPYRALDPATYAWVHATGFPVYRHAQRYLGARPFTAAEEHRLYAEWLQVGRVLGLPDRVLPQTPEEFWPYYRRVLAAELEPTAAVRELLSLESAIPAPDRGPRALLAVLRPLWPLLRPPFLRVRRFLTVGLMPPEARAALGLPWTARQERRLRRTGLGVRAVTRLLPERLRYMPLARAARRERRTAAP